MKTTILWLRRDLRLHDNAAFSWACENSDIVIPVYIYSAEEEQPWVPGAASRWWLHHSLVQLEKKFKDAGLVLHYFSGSSAKVLAEVAEKTGAEALVFNRLYESHLYKRDTSVYQSLSRLLEIRSFDSGLFFSPGTVLNNQQLPYRVFTPFYKKVRPMLNAVCNDYCSDVSVDKPGLQDSSVIDFDKTLDELGLLDEHIWHEKLGHYWQPGEDGAYTLLDNFIDDRVRGYQENRDVPSIKGTSSLSPYLHFGEITPQQIYLSLLPLLEGESDAESMQSAEIFLKQLLWREFAHNVLWHFPETATRAMDRRFKKSFWRANEKDFISWQRGETGIPIVDAGMKQLWETGWMHNRVRMIVSSFLTKNLGISWTQGAKWFWDTLVDADLANNSLGWQWVAGCGVDAAPYYRIFNPHTQTRRFDPALKYVNDWVPGHVELDYPAPVVDLASSRDMALQKYKHNISS